MNPKYLVYLLFSVLFSQVSYSQVYQQENDATHIKTVIFRPAIANTYTPIAKLGTPLVISFDDTEADEKDYYYKIEHYNYDWTLSDLLTSEFLNGYDQDRIRTYENSFNTLQYYTHYKFTIPNKVTKLKISGNYVLSIIDEDDTVVFTRRFVLYEPKVDVGVRVVRTHDIATIQEKQSVEFTVHHPNLHINNPKKEIKITVLQNENWQTAIRGLEPMYFKNNQLIYKYNKKTSYWAGNEFWNFENKSVRNSTVSIANVELGDEIYHTYLYTNIERIDKPYTYFPDVNGNFVVRNINGRGTALEADYTWVHFYLECLEDLEGKELYVSGAFNNWQLNDENLMTYNDNSQLYEAQILLKQGFVNYQFLTKDENGNLSNHDVDGSYFQTENQYTVFVYYRKFGSRYDRVIGVGNGNSEAMFR
ncbi:MAG: DUF5103 domain-containing protein [Flavobacteriaceae bacterium]|nr:DUF5103 domain-containing protein [Flavobacteriaceae bacterium]